jgi:hypothetical protein
MPIMPTLRPARARAVVLGRQSRSSATARIRARVADDTPALPFSAYETADFETPAIFAISVIVGLLTPDTLTPGGVAKVT